MISHRLKLAIRVMYRQRFFTLLNLSGLAIGSACFLLIYLYVTDELAYDQFHEHKQELYRVNMTNIWIESVDMFGSTSPAVAEAIVNDVPQIKQAIRLFAPYFFGEQMVSITESSGQKKSYKENRILAGDHGFFDLFTFPVVEGDQATALEAPNAVVLTKEMAEKYFPEQSAVGQQLVIGTGDNQKTFKVTAVIADLPDQSHFHFDMLLSMSSFPHVINRSDSWIWTAFVTYALLEENANESEANSILANLPAKYVGEEEASQKNWKLELQNIADIRLRSDGINNRLGPVGSQSRVSIFTSVAILILILSCINFMNLSTARFSQRAKEIGVQKVMGSTRNQIRQQFIIESLLFSTFSVLIGFGLAEILKPFFNALSDKTLSLNLFQDPWLFLIMLGMISSIGLLSGSYPAWFMTRFNLLESLKGVKQQTVGKFNFRNSLVLFQFTISIALIASALLVKDQLTYLNEKELGFDNENLIVVEHLEWLSDKGKLFRDQVANAGIISNPSLTSEVPPNCWNQDRLTPLNSSKTEDLSVTMIMTDPYFMETLGIELVAGRNFFTEGEGDINSIIINEKCAVQMGWLSADNTPESVLGRKISYYGDLEFTVIGVVKDFNFWALHSPVEPLALLHQNVPLWQPGKFMMGRVSDGKPDRALASLQELWDNLYPTIPFNYHFVDQAFDAAFRGQQQFAKVLNIFTFLAIAIAVLGLIGLISFSTEQRTKEFGIRKVLGANFKHLVQIISYDFIKPLIVAIALGCILALYFGNQWLSNFTYQTNISINIFLISASIIFILIMIITSLIVGSNAKKDPATILRDD